MLQPPIAVVPKQFALMQTFPPKKDSTSNRGSVATAQQKLRTNSAPKKSGTPSASSNFFRDPAAVTTTATTVKEDALVLNLKQQVQCLELEVQYLKQQQPSANHPMNTPASPTAIAALNQTIGSTSVAQRANRDELVVRAQELESEVVELRQKYALREKSFQLELAELRHKISSETQTAGASRSVHEAMQRREADLTRDIATMKQLHAQEVVALQRTVERLELETQDRQAHVTQLVHEKEALLKDIVSIREEARVALSATDSAKKQLEQAMIHVATEQGGRRAAEVRETAARQEVEGLRTQLQSLDAKLAAALEAKQRSEADALNAGYEVDQLRLTVQRQKDELGRATQEAVQAKGKTSEVVGKFSDLEAKLSKAAQGLVDLQSEREYFRLQVDRLKVENSVLEVKVSQLEQALNAERATTSTMERQLCSALEQADSLRRDARGKEEVYRKVDSFSTEVRVQLRTAQEERAVLQKRLEETSDALAKAQTRLEQVKSVEDQQRTEQQLQQALIQLSRSKLEMQSILQQQQRVADAFNVALDDLPEVAVNRSHHHQHHHLASTSGMHLGDAIVQATSESASSVTRVEFVTDSASPASPANLQTSVLVTTPSAPTVLDAPRDEPAASAPASAAAPQSTDDIRRELQAMSERIQDEERRAAELLLRTHS